MKKSEDESAKADLAAGIDAAERVLTKANEEVNRDLLDEALEDLRNRVDDWKNHKVGQFGRLLQHGVYTVVTGKTEQEKDVSLPLPASHWPDFTNRLNSMRFIFLSAFFSAAKRSIPIKARTRRTRPNRLAPKYETRMRVCN